MQATSWRDVLESIISNPAERERIAGATGVRSITLMRWIQNETTPRLVNLRRLLTAVPAQYQNQLRELLLKEFPDLVLPPNEETDELLEELPHGVVNEVLLTRATEPDRLRFWTISRQVLQSALRQLDPEQVGMAISLLQCMPPTGDGKIHSLREIVGLGTAPWESDVEPKALFLGAESLAGHAITSGHFEQIEDLRNEETRLPAHRFEHEVSAAANPITFAGRVAGCFLLSSTQAGAFLPHARRLLIQRYTNLAALAFETDEFYPPNIIELRVVPAFEEQWPFLASFRRRVFTLMNESERTAQPINMLQAEQVVWRQLEEILLDLPPRDPAST